MIQYINGFSRMINHLMMNFPIFAASEFNLRAVHNKLGLRLYTYLTRFKILNIIAFLIRWK